MAAPWTNEDYDRLKNLCEQNLSRKEIADRMKMPYRKVVTKIWKSPELSEICKREPNTRGPAVNHGTDTMDRPLPIWGAFTMRRGDEFKTAGSRWKVVGVYDSHFVAEKLTGGRYRESFLKRDFVRVEESNDL